MLTPTVLDYPIAYRNGLTPVLSLKYSRSRIDKLTGTDPQIKKGDPDQTLMPKIRSNFRFKKWKQI